MCTGEPKDICRICLEDDVLLDWNTSLNQFQDMTYKDCYYKYTQLECYETDPFPKMLCQNCCKALYSTHTLILTALDSHKVLQDKFNSQPQELKSLTSNNETVSDTPAEFETILVEETEIERIFDDDFECIENSDEDFSMSCRTTVKVEEKNRDPVAVCVNVKSKPEKEQLVKTLNRFKGHKHEVNRFKGHKHEVNTSSIESECNSKFKYRKANAINDNKNKMIIEFFSDEEERVDCDSIEYDIIDDSRVEENLMNSNKIDEEEETIKVKAKTNKRYQQEATICSICSKILNSKRAVEKHERVHLQNRERKETCKICGLKFYSQSNLDGHMLTHKENREKQHKCEFCSKAFYNKGTLNVHRRIHLGQMIPCKLCSKHFFRQIDLDRHMNSHSATAINSDTKMITKYFVRCPHCDKSIRSTTFKAHTAAHLNEPLMKCTICDKEFFTRKNCVRHVKKNHQKTNEEYNDFIVKYAKNRISHLFLKQYV